METLLGKWVAAEHWFALVEAVHRPVACASILEGLRLEYRLRNEWVLLLHFDLRWDIAHYSSA